MTDIKQAIADVGGTILSGISNVAPQTGGSIAKVIDKVGNFFGNPLPSASSGDATNVAQKVGGEAEGQKVYDQLVKQGLSPDKAASLATTSNKQQQSGGEWQTKQLDLSKSLKDQNDSVIKENIDVIKSLYNYDGWNDNDIVANFKATGGDGKSKAPAGDSGDGGGGSDPEGDAKAKYREITGEDPTADLLEKWKKSGQDLTKLAEENARLDMENADREYKATMDALGLQKGYIKSSAEKQRNRWGERETELKGEADVQSEKDLAKVEKEKESYEGEYEGDKSTLAQNWKDLSRYTQSLQRASGRQDSSFGNFAETKQLMDFNKGLRVLATKHSGVLGEFATAVTDTLDYYKQQKSEITRSVSDSLAKIDDWEEAQIVSIQGQEGISLAKKLSDINNATKQANNLKMQIQQNIDNKISTLDTWLLQTKVNFQDQVALLAKSASGAASSKDAAAALSTYLKNMKSSLDLGMSSYVTDPIVAGNVNKGEYLYDATTGKYIPVKGGTGKQYEQEKESGLNVAKTFLNNALGEI